MNTPCPLCFSNSQTYDSQKQRQFFLCENCNGIFVHPDNLLSPEEERKRYLYHQNDANNVGYQNFVMPIVNAVIKNYKPEHLGLDFGAGTGSALSKLLKDKNYNVIMYDPFFHPDTEILSKKFDYIVCCEVMEHFHHPEKEFRLLRQLLNKSGMLFCMTNIYNPSINFGNWYYKNDPTHTFFYQETTLHRICELFDFAHIEIEGNLISFTVSD